MSNQKFIYTVFGLALLIASLHQTALAFFLYFEYWWFDIMMHFLGGLLIGTLVYWFAQHASQDFPEYIRNPSLATVVLAVLVVGGLWEIFEIYAGIQIDITYKFDTAMDLVMDSIGAAAAFFFANIIGHDERIKS